MILVKLIERKEYYQMEIEKFNKLVLSNFDVSFNYKDVYYEISTYEKENKDIISLADENHWYVEFDDINDLDNYILIDKKISEIITMLSKEDIYY